MSWISSNLINTVSTWNSKFSEIVGLLLMPPEAFNEGGVWKVIVNINGAMQAIALALLVLFFVIGVMKTCGNFAEIKRPEQALKLFIRFAIAKGIITYGMELLTAIIRIVQGVASSAYFARDGAFQIAKIPDGIFYAIEACSFWDKIPLGAVTILGSLFVTVLSFIMILTVYGRFFKLYMYTSIAPIPLSTFAGEPTQNIGKSFLKSYAAVCLEGVIIVIACIIFSAFISTTPTINPDDDAITMVWGYLGQLIFNMLILVGTVRMSDRIVKEMMGL